MFLCGRMKLTFAVLTFTFFGRQTSPTKLQSPMDVIDFAFVLLPLLFKEGPKLDCKELWSILYCLTHKVRHCH